MTEHNGFDLDPEEDLYKILSCRDTKVIEAEYGGLEGISSKLKTHLKTGLTSDDDLEARRIRYGRNQVQSPPPATFFELFFNAWGDTAIVILTVAAAVALLAGILEAVLTEEKQGWIEGVAIIVAVLVVASVSAGNDYNKDLQFQKLKKRTAEGKVIRVIRNGEEQDLSLHDVCVGDVLAMKQGNMIPCDGLYIPIEGLEGSAADIVVDESAMTGEPLPRKKNPHEPVMWSGTKILQGGGHMLVLAVGSRSEWGKLMEKLQEEETGTPLQEKLEGIVVQIGKVGVVVAVIVFIVLMIYWFIDNVGNPQKTISCTNDTNILNETNPVNNTCPPDVGVSGEKNATSSIIQYKVPGPFDPFSLIEALKNLIISITIVVVAVPEGLPLAVTISLAYSMALMAKDQNLVRHLSACETMGGATNICSDKTGTLTENKMTVVKGWIAGKPFNNVSEVDGMLSKKVKKMLIESCVLNLENANLQEKNGAVVFSGLPTECCLLVFSEKISGAKYTELQQGYTTVHRWGFTSARKKMSTIVKSKDGDAKFRLYCKGAAERVLELSKAVVTHDGNFEKMDGETRKKLEKFVEKMAKKGLRTLTLAFRDFSKKEKWAKSEDGQGYEEDLTLIGVVAIEDPIRKEVPDAVFACQVAGITVRMVTGDNILTAQKIAKECGILTKNGMAMEGPKFAKLKDEELDKILREEQLQVLARSQPIDKHRLVTRLIHVGEVVAVTGDGTNDAPALKAADVGLAMGTGTDVAHEASDIIILDDNFASIVKAVRWGRCVYDNIRKFLQFQLTVNVVALIVAFVGAITRFGRPLTAIQLLWVNLIMDSFAALALGTEKPTDELLKRKPYGRESKIVTPIMWRNIIGQSLIQVAVTFIILYALDYSKPYPQPHLFIPEVYSSQFDHKPTAHYTMIFNTFVLMQVVNEINSRKLSNHFNVFENLHTNYTFLGVIGFTVVVQVILVFVGGIAFNVQPLTGYQWLTCIVGALIMLVSGAIWRLIPVPLEDWEVERDPEIIKKALLQDNQKEETDDEDNDNDNKKDVEKVEKTEDREEKTGKKHTKKGKKDDKKKKDESEKEEASEKKDSEKSEKKEDSSEKESEKKDSSEEKESSEKKEDSSENKESSEKEKEESSEQKESSENKESSEKEKEESSEKEAESSDKKDEDEESVSDEKDDDDS